MDSWSDDYTRGALRGGAEMLANFSNQLKMRLTPEGHYMTPDDVLFLLNHITSFTDAMRNTCKVANQVAMDKPT